MIIYKDNIHSTVTRDSLAHQRSSWAVVYALAEREAQSRSMSFCATLNSIARDTGSGFSYESNVIIRLKDALSTRLFVHVPLTCA